MPRLSREITAGSICHVYQRGNNKEFIFQKENSKSFFLNQIIKCNKKFDFEILAFVIMSNHYHIIIKLNSDPLDKIMFSINNSFAHYYNKDNERTGHVFETRYQCKKVDSNAYLLWLLRYVHRNPIRIKMVNKLEDYKWSSHNLYMRNKKSLFNTEYILNIISSNKWQARRMYIQLVSVYDSYYDDTENYERINDLLEEKAKRNEVDIRFETIKEKEQETLESIGWRVFKDKLKMELILSGCKRRDLTEEKLKFIKEALGENYTLKEISRYLNNSEAAISLLLSRRKKEC